MINFAFICEENCTF